MLVKRIHVEHFRCIQSVDLNVSDLTVLVGRNGAGKSTLLHALAIFYDVSAPITEEDYFGRTVDDPIVIRVTFGNLNSNELTEFAPYVQGELLTVTKKIEYVDGKPAQRYFAASLQIPQFAEIRAAGNKTQQRMAWNQLVDSASLPELPGKVTKAEHLEELMRSYEEEHPELCQHYDREDQFFGPKNVGGGKMDKYTKFVYVPAVQKVSDELGAKRGTYLTQLLDTIVYRRISARPDVIALKHDFETRVQEVFSAANLTEINDLSRSLDMALSQIIPGASIVLGWEPTPVPEIPNPLPSVSVGEDGFWGDVSRKGHGLQRGLIIALLQQLALAAPLTTKAMQEAAPTSDKGELVSDPPDLILAVEEPELYQHPLRCRYLARLFAELTDNSSQSGITRNQIILSTHSPWFVDLSHFDSVRVVRKTAEGDKMPSSEVTEFTLAEAADEMARINGGSAEHFTAESFRARALPVMTSQVNEGFFADKVVIVEGMTEAAALWAIAESMSVDLVSQGIAVLPAGGKNNIDRPTIVFRGLGIPTFFLFDGDANHKQDQEESARRNRHYLALAKAPVEDFPATQVHQTWGCFNNDIEDYFRDVTQDQFQTIRDNVAASLGYSEPSRVLKNYDAATRFVETANKAGYRFEVIEQIVNAVLQL